jgi:hypothetical protein
MHSYFSLSMCDSCPLNSTSLTSTLQTLQTSLCISVEPQLITNQSLSVPINPYISRYISVVVWQPQLITKSITPFPYKPIHLSASPCSLPMNHHRSMDAHKHASASSRCCSLNCLSPLSLSPLLSPSLSASIHASLCISMVSPLKHHRYMDTQHTSSLVTALLPLKPPLCCFTNPLC